MSNNYLTIRAGRRALAMIKDEGLSLDRVKVLAGASGAAKYLVLTGIDRTLLSLLAKQQNPLHLIGTSIGAFRMAAFCHPNPHKAYDRLEHEYIHQYYPKGTGSADITRQARHMINAFIADDAIEALLCHPTRRINFLSNRCKGLLAYENKLLQSMGMLTSALGNAISRNALGLCFERALFVSPKALPPFANMNQFPIKTHELNKKNFKAALLSSGSIPIAMQGVSDIDGIKGVFRDGGILDYHLDIPFLPPDDESLVLYPHFYPHIIPGWFDKFTWRKATERYLEQVVLIAPSAEFINQLPYQKIPDRKDFKTFVNDDKARIRYWKETVLKSQCLGDIFAELVESKKIRDCVSPLI